MAEITTTQAFSDGDTVTATKLNNITANAAIQTEAITNRSAETTVDQANDLLLMYDASATALKKVSLSNVIKAGTASNFPVTGNATIGGTLGVTGVISAASTLELGHASDTTLSRGAAGRLQVEGVDVPTISSTDTLTNKTLTSPAISGGTINNAVIGGATAAAGSFTTLSATSPITTQAGTAASPAIQPTGDTNTGIFFPAADTIAFSEGGTEAMRIDSSGNVGIGTQTINSRLEVRAAGVMARFKTGTAGDGRVEWAYNTTDVGYIGADTSTEFSVIARSGNALKLGAGGSERLRIDSSGNVGIGTTSPNNSLDVVSDSGGIAVNIRNRSANDYGYLRFQNNSGSSTQASIGNLAGQLTIETGTTERLRIDSSGNVGIGTTSPSVKLQVNGDLKLAINASIETDGGTLRSSSIYNSTTASAGNVNIDVNGYLQRSTSSIRYKKDIQDAVHGLSEVMLLRPVTFKQKNQEYSPNDRIYSGFIAEEVHSSGLTEFVEYNKDNEPESIFYQNMVSLLAKAIQELKLENDSLKSRVAALEAA